jgi:Mor family transcriptional regulator
MSILDTEVGADGRWPGFTSASHAGNIADIEIYAPEGAFYSTFFRHYTMTESAVRSVIKKWPST